MVDASNVPVLKWTDMTLDQLAAAVRRDWPKPYFGAVPYLDAMGTMTDMTESYGQDSAASIVRYFLANATSWRGPVARVVKAELKRRLAK